MAVDKEYDIPMNQLRVIPESEAYKVSAGLEWGSRGSPKGRANICHLMASETARV